MNVFQLDNLANPLRIGHQTANTLSDLAQIVDIPAKSETNTAVFFFVFWPNLRGIAELYYRFMLYQFIYLFLSQNYHFLLVNDLILFSFLFYFRTS